MFALRFSKAASMALVADSMSARNSPVPGALASVVQVRQQLMPKPHVLVDPAADVRDELHHFVQDSLDLSPPLFLFVGPCRSL